MKSNVTAVLLFIAASLLNASVSESERKLAEKTFGKVELKESSFKKKSFLTAVDSAGAVKGYILFSQTRGHEGEIKLLTSLSSEALVLDYAIVEAKDTEKLKELDKADFAGRCKGKSSSELKLTVFDVKNGKVDAVTGATMTSRVLVSAFRDAAYFFEELAESSSPKKQAGTITVNYRRSSEGKWKSKNEYFYTSYRTAVWIEDSMGRLIKTLYRSVGGKIEPFPVHLVNWEKKSGKISDNTPDTYTGASIKGGRSETSYTFTWDCKDIKGRLVPDGKYNYYVEVARYYQNDNNSPFRRGGPQSSLNSGVIEKSSKRSASIGVLDSFPPAILESLSAKFEPK